ncbi:MAG: RsmF rRNA methyltransferase first C-terminal domain-containing protein [Trueperaceae bacterium]
MSSDENLAELPAAFMRRLRALLGEQEARELFAALSLPPTVGLRLNTLRGAATELAARLPWELSRVPWCPSAFTVGAALLADGPAVSDAPPSAVTPGRHHYQLAGAYYLQDPAATAVAEALAPAAGDLVLDLAAAPGGKSTHLAALLAGTGWLVANDVHPQRALALVSNLERCGVRNATVTNETPERLAQVWPERFDRVLLDAPCSGEGMFRKSVDALKMWSEQNVQLCAARQDALLLQAARLVKPGGYLAYSTCTLAPEENEGSVARFVAASGFQIVPLQLAGTDPGRPDWSGGAPLPELSGTARIWPHRGPGEGHFVALLRRPPGGTAAGDARPARQSAKSKKSAATAPPRPALTAWHELASEALAPGAAAALAPTGLQGEWLLRAQDSLPLGGIRWLRHGLQLGRFAQGAKAARVEPAHALAMGLPPGGAARRLDLRPHDPRLAGYLAGADVEGPGAPGYLRVEVDGLPLGWGKRSGTRVRSLLPKGLRRPG